MVPCPHILRVMCLLTSSLALLGCTETPSTRLAYLNPYWRKQWQEDELYAKTKNIKTYYDQRDDIQAIAASAKSLPPPDQERIAQQFAERYRTEANPVLKSLLIRSLGEFSSPTAHQVLQDALQDEDPELRKAVVQALGGGRDAAAVELLGSVIRQDENKDVRLAATRVLSNFRDDPAAVRALGVALEDPDPALQYCAMLSLRMVTQRDLGDNVAVWRDYVNSGEPFSPRQQSLADRLRNLF